MSRQTVVFDEVYLNRTTKTDENGNKICINCGEILPKRRWLYCSDKCNMEFYKKHVKDWGIFRLEVFKRDNYTCQMCGKKQFESDVECDHIIPIFRGGAEFDKNNLQTLCRRCHKKKTRLDKNPIVGKVNAEIRLGVQKQLDVGGG